MLQIADNETPTTLLLQQVELNKEGKIEITESPNEPNGSVVAAAALENALTDISSASGNANTSSEIEQIQHDNSVTTDPTASPTDSYPAHEEGYLNESSLIVSGNATALEGSTPTTEVSEAAKCKE